MAALIVTAGGAVVPVTAAALSDQAPVTGTAVSTGFTNLDAGLTGPQVLITYEVPELAPGQVVTRPFTVRNTDTLALRYSATSVTSTPAAAQTQVTIKSGVAACATDTFGASGSVVYGPGALGSSSGTRLFGDPAWGQQNGDRAIPAGSKEVLCIQTSLPSSAPAGVTAQSTTLRFDKEQNTGAYADAVKAANPLWFYRLNDPDTQARDVISTRTGTYLGGYRHDANPPVAGDPTSGSTYFDGKTGYVDLPDATASQFANGITISGWVYPTGNGQFTRLLELGNGPENANIIFGQNDNVDGFWFSTRDAAPAGTTYNPSNSATWGAAGGTLLTGRGDVPRNAWSQMTLTMSPSGATSVYVNGILNTTAQFSPLPQVARTQNFIAKSSWPTAQGDSIYDGNISEVAVFDRVLTAAQIRTVYDSRDANPATGRYINEVRAHGPVATYRLNDASGTTAKDTAGSRSGAYNGGVSLNQPMSLGADSAERSVTLNGSSGYVSLPYSPAYQFERGLSVSAWVRPTAYTSWARVFEMGRGPDADNFFLAQDPSSAGALTYTLRNASGTVTSSVTTAAGVVPLNAWSLVALTIDQAGKPRIYVNGALVATGTSSVPVSGVQRDSVWLGRSLYTHDGWWTGSMSEVSTWNRALSTSEIASLWAAR